MIRIVRLTPRSEVDARLGERVAHFHIVKAKVSIGISAQIRAVPGATLFTLNMQNSSFEKTLKETEKFIILNAEFIIFNTKSHLMVSLGKLPLPIKLSSYGSAVKAPGLV